MIGLDPGPFTFRELMLMADEKKRVAGELAAWHIAQIVAMFGEKVDPGQLNPYRVVSRAEKEARERLKKQRFFAAMSVGLFGRNVMNDPLPTEAK